MSAPKAFIVALVGCVVSGPALASIWSDLWSTREQQGQKQMQASHPAEAAQLFSDPRRRAYAESQAGQYAKAADLLAPIKDADSQFNRGNALARGGKLQDALKAYDAALAASPGNEDVLRNKDLVAKALEDQQHPQQGKDGSGQNGKGQQGQSNSGGQSSNGAGDKKSGGNDSSSQGGKSGQAGQQDQSGQQSQAGQRDQSGQQGQSDQQNQSAQQAQPGQNGNQSQASAPNQPRSASQAQAGQQGQPDNRQQQAANAAAANQSSAAQQAQANNPQQGANASQSGTPATPTNAANPAQPQNPRQAAAAAAAQPGQQDQRGTPAFQQGQASGTGTQQGEASMADSPLVKGGAPTAFQKTQPRSEQALSLDQWLRGIPEDSGELLRRKFQIEHMLKQQGNQP